MRDVDLAGRRMDGPLEVIAKPIVLTEKAGQLGRTRQRNALWIEYEPVSEERGLARFDKSAPAGWRNNDAWR